MGKCQHATCDIPTALQRIRGPSRAEPSYVLQVYNTLLDRAAGVVYNTLWPSLSMMMRNSRAIHILHRHFAPCCRSSDTVKVLGSSLCHRYSLEPAANLKSYSLDWHDMSICLLDIVDRRTVVLTRRCVASSDIIITEHTSLDHPGHCGDDLLAHETMGFSRDSFRLLDWA